MAGERPDPDPGQAAATRETHAFAADRGDQGVRLDLVLLRHVRGSVALSRRRLQRAIEDGRVTVNGGVATRTAARVVAGDRIEARLPVPRQRDSPQPQPLPLDVLFEDEGLLAVNKPAGIVVHPSYRHADGTLYNAVLWHLRGSGVRPRLVNRLDKDTSGVVLVSKSRDAHGRIVRAMRSGAVSKEYLAIVNGVPTPSAGTITSRLRRDPFDVRRVSSSQSDGKESATRYETVDSTKTASSPLSLVRCELLTGRMHQIRVHLAERGWPILGDRVYGAPAFAPDGANASADKPFPRQALHAWRISVPHPATGARLIIVAPIPGDLRALMDALGLENPPALACGPPALSSASFGEAGATDQRPTTNDAGPTTNDHDQ